MEERLWHQHYDYNVQTEYRIPRLTVFDLLGIPANANPDKAALNYYGTEISYYDLRQMSLRLANAFLEMGVKQGDRVGLHLPNVPQYVIGYYAAMSLGAVIVNFSPLYTPDELVPLIEQTGVTTLITCDITVAVIKEVCKRTNIPRVIACSMFDYLPGAEVSTSESLQLEPEWFHFSQVLEGSSNTKKPKVEIKQEDPAMIQFTGGTTGIPKGALLTQNNMITGSFLCSLWGGGTIGDTPAEKRIIMVALPLFHVYANIVCMNWSMINSATMILVPRFEIDAVMDLIENFDRITFFPAVPTMISAIINHPKAKELDIAKKVQLLNSGGGPIPVEVIDKVEDLGLFYGEGWGMSETTSLGIANPVLGLSKPGSIGVPFPMMDAKLVDIENGEKEVAQGEPGELLVKGPLVMKEYWENPEKTAAELKDGWLHTGDVAIMDEDGYFFIVDRKKDMIIAGGYNIYPRDIDEVLYQHPKVADAISVGIPHEYRGETVKAYIVLKPGETCTEQEIIDFCKEKLAVYKVPKLVDFRDELPKSAVGKILRKVLRQEEADKLKG